MMIAIDIETVRHERADAWWNKTEIKAPANYKDQVKIDAYIKEKKAALGSKSALTWHTGKVFSIAFGNIEGDTIDFNVDLDEAKLLTYLSDMTNKVNIQKVYSKSGKTFDYPFLVGRYLANKLTPPRFLSERSCLYDVDDFFVYSAASSQRMSLEAYAYGLGIEGKFGDYTIVDKVYSGMITNTCSEDDLSLLMKYNKQDVEIVKEMVKRYYGM